jgi:hypothetical protein
MRDGGPTRAVLFAALLFLPQAGALALQVRGGFRPFAHEPRRVPLSWDMFAVRIDRCDVEWDPPLPAPDAGDAGLRRLSERGLRLEWFPVYALRSHYRDAAWRGCELARKPTQVRLVCYTPEGRTVRDAFACT